MTALTLVPVAVHAQQDVIDVSGGTSTTSSTTTTDATKGAGIPNTGIAPKSNKFAQTSSIFIAGSAIGAGLGFGAINLRKRRQDS